MKTLSAEQWYAIGRRIFASWGAPEDIAACVARSLVEADLVGVASHGLARIPNYHAYWQAGWFKPGNRAEVVREGPAAATLDGHWGFGQPAMHAALDLGIAKCREQGIAAVGLQHSGHIGRLGEYAERAAAAGVVAIVMASGGSPGGLVAPYGGAQRVLSTNPFAAGVPAGAAAPFVMDFATSQVAAARLELAPDQDMPIPEGWAVAAGGSPARTPREFIDGGALLPFGAHKGYALGLLIELICGGLTAAGLSERPERIVAEGLGGNAAFVITIDVAHFAEPGAFGEAVDAFFARLKGVRPALGSDGVVIPGEPEAGQRARHAASGITVPTATWDKIVAVGEAQGLHLGEEF